MNLNEENNRTDIPENNPSKGMNSKQEVAQSPDEKTDQDFPGYPHYPAKEDIMDQRTGSHRVDANLEELGTGPNASGVNQRFLAGQDHQRSHTAEEQDTDQEDTGMDGRNEERGVPQNVSNDELNRNADLPGSDVEEAADKGSLNP